ncbi:hypothetical protein CYY_009445 [Polysphondylium violaceum]|uniref:Transmembrane protein n=1 Tax=Polysphondylium violaceum TaxID=133409 RepID=A0A8J4PTN2_9MYCE|nr:hypothetical protein CYY_009445 [Polysphondylium violaceum]
MYSFFVSDEIRIQKVRGILVMVYIFGFILLCYQIPITIVSLKKDISLIEGIGFLILIFVYATGVFINGSVLLKSLKNHKKKSQYKHFNVMILKTKVLLVTLVTEFLVIVVHDLVFNFAIDQKYNNFPISTLITGIVDLGQMIVVMFVLANGKFYKYFKFQRVRSPVSYSTSDGASGESKNSGSKGTNISKSFDSKSIDASIDLSVSVYNNNSKSKFEQNDSRIIVSDSNPNENNI